jgi:type I restriction enzyme S subunit
VRSAPLSELASLIDYGVTASATKDDNGRKFLRITDIQDGAVDWASVPFCDAVSATIVRSRLAVGDIVFARTGATTGKSFLIRDCPENAVFASYLIRVRAGQKIDPGYLAHFFDSPGYWRQIAAKSAGAAQPGVNASKLGELIIPFPPLPEQKRIAAILDHAGAIRRKRQRASRSLYALPTSTFRDMFGDLVANDSDFEEGTVADLVAGFDTGKNLAPDPDNEEATNRVLKVSAVTSGYFRASEAKPLPDSYAPPLAHFINQGDLLFSRANTEALIGATALVDEAVSNLVLPDKIWRFKWRDEPEPTFVHHLFQSMPFRREISRRASGTSGSMKNIGKDKVLSIPLGLPPKVKRFDFARQVENFANAGRNARTASAIADALFISLQHRAFSGEL